MGLKLDLGLGVNSGGGKLLSPEARRFIAATGITDGNQKRAITYLVRQLKANNLYSKFSALYPFVGGSADSHKFNLINPADSDAAFRIVWSGSVTHNASGIKSNGTNGYGNTKYNPVAASASLTSFSMGLYKKGTEANGTSRVLLGNQQSTGFPLNVTALGWLNAGGTEIGVIGGKDSTEYTPPVASPNAQSNGIISINTNGSRTQQLWTNGSKDGTTVLATENFYNAAFFVLANNITGTAGAYSVNSVVSLIYISTGLSDSEMATLHTIITAYQTLLGRA